ncbi:hypothetical protein Tco_0027161 [Tanacetum coccineum]
MLEPAIDSRKKNDFLTNATSSSTRPSSSTRHKGKEIAKPVTPQSESVSDEDSDPEQAQRDKEMQKNLALLAKCSTASMRADLARGHGMKKLMNKLGKHITFHTAKIQTVLPEENDILSNHDSINEHNVLEKDDSNVTDDSSKYDMNCASLIHGTTMDSDLTSRRTSEEWDECVDGVDWGELVDDVSHVGANLARLHATGTEPGDGVLRRFKGTQDNRRRDAWNSGNKDGSRTAQKEDSKALVTVDGEGVDWSHHSEDEDYALMALMQSIEIYAIFSRSKKVEAQFSFSSTGQLDYECVSIPIKQQETPSFANKQVKTPRENVKSQNTHNQKPKVDKKELGHGFAVRACFVCGSLNHLIRDCDFHEKRMARKADLNNGWNNVHRVNKQNQYVPSAVLTRTGIIPVSTARASSTKNFSTARQSFNRQTVLTNTAMKVNTVKPIVNRVRPTNVFHKTHSPTRPFKKTTVLRQKISNQKFNTAKANAVSTVGEKGKLLLSPQQAVVGDHKDTMVDPNTIVDPVLEIDYPHRALKNKGIVDSGCSRHMTGNKAYLDEFQDFNGGPVAFGGSRGYITGKVNPTHAYYNGSCTSKDTEDPSWSTSFKTMSTQKTSSALEALWKTLFVLYLYLIGTLYLKGKPKLGLWYPKVSSFDLESYSDSDYAGANLDRKSTTEGCQFLGRRLIFWQCKKQTIVATSTTEAEYVAAASCCGPVLWIQNQMLDYGFNFMNTKIYIDNESTICIVKNPVYHSKTKHIAIRHHFIRDAYEKKLIQVLKIHTDDNVADLLTKAFDVSSKMAVLDSCPKHNMVAYLEKSEGNAEFHEIIDFLKRSSIHHALTVSPVVSTTFVEQFWTSAKSKTINNVRHITAKVAGKSVSISEASIRSDLLFDDADGIDSLPNQAIFDAIQLMGSKSTSWDQIPTNIATAVICLTSNQKYNFSKLIFDGKQLDNVSVP